ncbi:MAG: zf-HC2 domain-containing protein [Ignavibacteriales bacterium]|nr:zf-HC2 domain-containing protein [Ignavibacteriales bacterium]
MKHYDYEINLFIDGELEEENREELFLHLAECNECRNTFADLLLLKEKSKAHCSESINQLKQKPSVAKSFYKFGFYAASAAAVFLLFFLVLQNPKDTFITKNQARVDTVFVQKEIPTAQNQITNTNSLTPGKKEYIQTSQQEYLHYVMSLRTEKFTEADLIKLDNGSIQ